MRMRGPLALVLALGCSTATTRNELPRPARLRAIDFELRRESDPPVPLAGRIEMTNRGPGPETLSFPEGCLVRLRLYERMGGRVAPVWEGAASGCEQGPRSLALAPGQSASVTLPAPSAEEILADGVPPGRYRMAATLEPDGAVVEVEAGETVLSGPRR